MKQLILLLLIACTLVACKKEYNCQCATTVYFSNGQRNYNSKNLKMDRKLTGKQAKSLCSNEKEQIDATYKAALTHNGNTAAVASFITNCVLE